MSRSQMNAKGAKRHWEGFMDPGGLIREKETRTATLFHLSFAFDPCDGLHLLRLRALPSPNRIRRPYLLVLHEMN